MEKDVHDTISDKMAWVIETVYNRLELYRDRTLDLSPKELAILIKLGPDGEARIGELASRLDLPLSTVSWVADRMVQNGYLERFQDPDDRRAVMVRAASKGKETHGRHRRVFGDVASTLLMLLTDEEKEKFMAILRRIEEQMRELTPEE